LQRVETSAVVNSLLKHASKQLIQIIWCGTPQY